MKLIIRIIAIGILTYFLTPVTVWWAGMVVAFLVCYLSPSSGLNAFVAGLLGVGLSWMTKAWLLDVANESVFSATVAEIMQVSDPLFLIFGTAAVGGLSGGFASLSGITLRQMFLKKKKRSFYT